MIGLDVITTTSPLQYTEHITISITITIPITIIYNKNTLIILHPDYPIPNTNNLLNAHKYNKTTISLNNWFLYLINDIDLTLYFCIFEHVIQTSFCISVSLNTWYMRVNCFGGNTFVAAWSRLCQQISNLDTTTSSVSNDNHNTISQTCNDTISLKCMIKLNAHQCIWETDLFYLWSQGFQ